MIKTILLFTGLLVSFPACATVFLVDNFNYTNGPLVGSMGSPWEPHSDAGLQPILVTSGQIRVVGASLAEDDDAPLAGAPYVTPSTNGPAALYARFDVRFTALPTTAGTYFAHFLDDNFYYPCGIWASTANAATNRFRLGVENYDTTGNANSGQFNQDLSLNTTYTVVARLTLSNALCTLWLNPSSISSSNVTATNALFSGLTAISSYSFRQGPNGGTCLVDNLRVGDTFSEVISTNNPPFISLVKDAVIAPNTSLGPISFTVSDVETPATNLVVTASSFNTVLLPNSGITLSGSGTNRAVTLTPAGGEAGSTVVTLSVTDSAGVTTTTTFNMFVGVPNISCIASEIIPTNSNTGPIPFSISDLGESVTNLTLTAVSSDTTLVPASGIAIAGIGAQHTITVTPSNGLSGISTIMVTVSDGKLSNSSSFNVTVQPLLGTLLDEPFSYPDGTAIDGVGGWTNDSGTIGQTKVIGGRLLLSQTNTEVFHHDFGGATLATSNGNVIYVSFTINFSQLPGTLGDHFANFTGSNGAPCILYADTQSAPAGFCRLGIALFTTDYQFIAFHPALLGKNSDHTVVVQLNMANGFSTLWVDPTSDLSESVTDTTAEFFSPLTVTGFGFRQVANIGNMTVSNLLVGTSFTDVFTNAPENNPQLFIRARCDQSVEINWQAALTNFALQQSPSPDGSWSDYTNQGTLLGNHKDVVIYNPQGESFFRLNQP